jgi:hypothetical protein
LTQSTDDLTSASNQIVKDLRDRLKRSGFPFRNPEDPIDHPASKAVLAQAILTSVKSPTPEILGNFKNNQTGCDATASDYLP